MKSKAETVGDMSVGACSATGLISGIEQHASLYTLGISVLSLFVAILFYTLRFKMDQRDRERHYQLAVKESEKS